MKFTTVAAALLSASGVALAQGVTSAVAPAASTPAECSGSYDGLFEITVAKVEGAQKRDAPIAVSYSFPFVPALFYHHRECSTWPFVNGIVRFCRLPRGDKMRAIIQ